MAADPAMSSTEDASGKSSLSGFSAGDGLFSLFADGLPTDERVRLISSRSEAVRRQIDDAARAAGRRPEEVHLIAVTKFFPAEVAAAACAAGLQDLGENRVQELVAKQEALAGMGLSPRWHLIGTLQRNKVKYVIGRTHLIHSGDSLELLSEISRRSVAAGIETAVLLQLNPALEASKHGFSPDGFAEAAALALRLPGLRIGGLMAMAPLVEDPELARPFFQTSRDCFETLRQLHQAACPGRPLPDVLSMGMSHDFVQAIACGATHVRIGTAIFGPRPSVV